MIVLYRKDIPLLSGSIEDLEWFVEELKKLNPNELDRRDFKIISKNGFDELIKEWKKK